MNCIEKYFYLTPDQKDKFEKFKLLFTEWNSKINLVSRKDIEFLCINHVLHSLAIAKYLDLDGTKVIDVGTGGGFPGIPLAIMFPKSDFFLIDSIGKKIEVVNDIINKLELKNAKAQTIRSTELKGKYDFVLARAVTNFPKFFVDVKHLIKGGFVTNHANGIVYLKGGDFKEEIKPYKDKIHIENISEIFQDEFFDIKKIIHYKF
ncbi:MAG: 16S rRNA (guanine(527)-N(7))-methyltransferase RsmG [Bacteroidales bacterium]|nr:16S rRNA (guanine(527)-N(7))-methyltransferase RsmG [Bacteroidales bacterium]